MKYFRARPATWGFSQGLVAYLILAWLAPQWQWNLAALLAIGLVGATIGEIIFGFLQRAGRRTKSLGFLAISCLFPALVVVGGDSLHYGRLYFAGPLTLGFIILWTVAQIPFALVLALIFSRTNR